MRYEEELPQDSCPDHRSDSGPDFHSHVFLSHGSGKDAYPWPAYDR